MTGLKCKMPVSNGELFELCMAEPWNFSCALLRTHAGMVEQNKERQIFLLCQFVSELITF